MDMASGCGAQGRVVTGEALREGFPAIHAVGRAAECAPRLIDFSWGDAGAPRVTLVGKGVCFDSGGLDIKAPQGMLLMKKDMGGAACVLALARVIMESALPVRLRVLVPAVENSIAGNAYRPGDVLRTRKGLTVEVGNTDAEGRLVLSDALAAADADDPRLLVDMATLTGAARVALGPELPALFGSRDRDRRGAAAPRTRARGPAVADAALGRLRGRDREQGGRHEQRVGLDFRGGGDRRAVPAPLRERGARLAARGPLCLERQGPSRPVRRRRATGRACALRIAGRAIRLTSPASMDLGFERRAWTLIYVCLGVIEGGTAAVMVRSLFGQAVHGIAVDLVMALVSSAPAWANLVSLAFARRAQGRPKIAFLQPLIVALAVLVAALALVPAGGGGLCRVPAALRCGAARLGRDRHRPLGDLERELRAPPACVDHWPHHDQRFDRDCALRPAARLAARARRPVVPRGDRGRRTLRPRGRLGIQASQRA